MDESLEGLAWLIAALQANAPIAAAMTGGIWPIQAPEGTLPPFAIITPMGGRDVQGVAGYRLRWEGTFQVRLWGYATQSDALASTDKAVDALLQPNGEPLRHQATPSGLADVESCMRDNPLVPLPDWDGQQLRIGIGGLYRLQVRSLT